MGIGEAGIKYDQGKPDWSLVDLKVIEEFVKVLTFGAEKYTRDGWKTVDKDRVHAALLRHLAKYQAGQELDEESGLKELAHVMCNVYFLLYWDTMGKLEDDPDALAPHCGNPHCMTNPRVKDCKECTMKLTPGSPILYDKERKTL